MDRFDTLVYKGSSNTIDFSLRDTDRKPISLLDKTLTVFIQDATTKRLRLQRTLEVIDDVKGFARLTLTDTDLLTWPEDYYKYSVVVSEDNGREGFTFVDQVHRVTGTFELRDDAMPNPVTVLSVSTFNDESFFWDADTFVSSVLGSNNTNLHTFVWYLSTFSGNIKIQGSLNNIAPTADNTAWADLDIQTFLANAPGDGLVHVTLEGMYKFFRFIYEPDAFNAGTIDQVLYR